MSSVDFVAVEKQSGAGTISKLPEVHTQERTEFFVVHHIIRYHAQPPNSLIPGLDSLGVTWDHVRARDPST